MNILLTNDDGFNSEGINVLKSLLEKHGTVVIIAPDKHRSGASSSLTITDPIKVEKVEDKVFKLIQKANNRGGADNISVAYLVFDEEGEDK